MTETTYCDRFGNTVTAAVLSGGSLLTLKAQPALGWRVLRWSDFRGDHWNPEGVLEREDAATGEEVLCWEVNDYPVRLTDLHKDCGHLISEVSVGLDWCEFIRYDGTHAQTYSDTDLLCELHGFFNGQFNSVDLADADGETTYALYRDADEDEVERVYFQRSDVDAPEEPVTCATPDEALAHVKNWIAQENQKASQRRKRVDSPPSQFISP